MNYICKTAMKIDILWLAQNLFKSKDTKLRLVSPNIRSYTAKWMRNTQIVYEYFLMSSWCGQTYN